MLPVAGVPGRQQLPESLAPRRAQGKQIKDQETFGLTMGTERATALQDAVQDELMKQQYSTKPGMGAVYFPVCAKTDLPYLAQDPVVAEHITIMAINNKTAVIDSDFVSSVKICTLRAGHAHPYHTISVPVLRTSCSVADHLQIHPQVYKPSLSIFAPITRRHYQEWYCPE
ncbi:hypothetical protein BD309DRAFT_1048679 [Dichomitus squalens]|uniref:Uncharacterized protein n=1 Tax=Dichomitus squalens TaxID=114155 RepID=A0A4Q9Q5Z7_9APHY|nr:hypothetical protein BD309DRAFT_1048679 [Dichomitus squalens]TBU62863.1 hypothetical protein BD310DRAFT_945348 [Dichomitus squalens]